jgi:glycosyl transferase, family 25
MHGLRTWVINLDRAPDRLARISAQLQQLDLPFTRLPAVDARALTPAQAALLDTAAYHRRHGKTPVPGELGCYLSHLAVMHEFLAGDAAFALVLEDDVLLQQTLPDVLQNLLLCPQRWDMVKLSAVHSGTPVRVRPLTAGHHLAVTLTHCTAASAYLVNRRAAQAYVDQLLPMQLPFDQVFDQGWSLGLRVRLVTPTPCRHDDAVPSTMGYAEAPSRKFAWYRRGATYRYRLGHVLRRAGYGLKQVLQEWTSA